MLSLIRRLEAATPGRSRSVGEIARLAGIAPPSARTALIRLMLRGTVGRAAGGHYALQKPRRPPPGDEAS
ncbi:MAG TPA: hypothetical protein PKA13_09130 [Geminicoccaceae bacterium]|nr:hypothetical protein [Geminicoccus sp.]HMU49927.1 hypothetical protein [Geminicoccaceae bacterium]